MAEYIIKTNVMTDAMCTEISCRECSFDSADGCKLLKHFSVLPTIDIVHCSECKYGNHIDDGERLKCFHWLHRIDENCHKPNWFCADGERRNND